MARSGLFFYWLVPGVLAGCARPGVRNRRDEVQTLDQDLAWLAGRGIGAVVSMTETPLQLGACERHGLEVLHLPVNDLAPPAPAQFHAALAFIDAQRQAGRAVAVHCLMGQGRTGSVLAAYLIRDGQSPAAALADLRAVCPGAVENPAQERALVEFAAARDWLV